MVHDNELSLPEFLDKYSASTRLRNIANVFWHRERNSYKTVQEFLDSGEDALALMAHIPGSGRKTIAELKKLLEEKLSSQFTGSEPISGSNRERKLEIAHDSTPLSGEPEDIVEIVLGKLNEPERDIIQKRFGLAGGRRRTLEEIGIARGVTRERIRQIETKAIGKLQARFRGEVRLYVKSMALQVWAKLSHGAIVVTHDQLDKSFEIISPEEHFLMDLSFGSMFEVFNNVATPMGLGWVRGNYSKEQLTAYKYALNKSIRALPLPRPARDILLSAGLPDSCAGLEKLFLKKAHFRNGYVSLARFSRRIRRVIRLHQLLVNTFMSDVVQPRKLLDTYLATYKDDQCNYRDIEIVLVRFPHLFLNLYDEGWMGIGASTLELERDTDNNECGPIESDDIGLTGGEVSSELENISGALRAILQNEGPLPFVDLRKKFVTDYKEFGSRNSVGPILIAWPTQFIRLAPGIYGLPEHMKTPNSINDMPKLLLNARQCQLYCLARWAGETIYMFPLWTWVAEYGWASWARTNAEPRLFHSLLAIIEIDQWKVSETEKERWRELKRKHAFFQLEAQFCPSLTKTIPSLREIVGVACLARSRGRIGCISANRAIGARIDDTHVVSILAILIGMGLIKSARHWQQNHIFVVGQDSILNRLVDVANTTEPKVFAEKAKEIIHMACQTAPDDMGWVSANALTVLLDRLGEGSETANRIFLENDNDEDVSLADALREFRKDRIERRLKES